MLVFLVTLPLLLAATDAPLAAGEPPSTETVTVDGGDVPTVAPALTKGLAPILAPELVADGGTQPMVADATLSVYKVDLPVEATVTAGSLALFLIVDFVVKPTLEGDISCRRPTGNGRCSPADLTAFDRYSVGRASKEWQAFGDVALYTSILLPVLYLGLESIALPTTEPWGDFGNDLLVVAEAMALTGAMQTLMKFAFRRPRPARYIEVDAPLSTFDQELSFPSGHTSLVAAATTALTTTIFLRHPKSQVRYVVLGGGVLLTALTAFSRVEAGQHFPTDVMVGALIGGFAGFAVPYLHRKEIPLTPTAGYNPVNGTTSFSLAGTF
jgi:membrane-associated phospholipid phosphatase